MDLKTNIRSTNKRIKHDTDVYLVDTYGETKRFFNISKVAFIGGSLVKHGGQNPIEPARYKLNIIHGPNVENFKDIYQLFNKKKIAHMVLNQNQLINLAQKLLTDRKKRKINLEKIGNLILKKSIVEITRIFKDEIKKT